MELASIRAFMAIGAHCDDVDLRCGGTFARLTREGKRGCYVVAVENAYVRPDFPLKDSHEALATRRAESTRAAEILGADRIEWLQLKSYYLSTPVPYSRVIPSFDSLASLNEELHGVILEGLPPAYIAENFPRCVERLRTLILDFAPQVVFTHSPDDRHLDHYAVARFVERVVRDLKGEGLDIDLHFWEPGSAGPMAAFEPDGFVELSEEDVAAKRRAVDVYVSQIPPGFLETWVEDWARAYGALRGLAYAEVFRRAPCAAAMPWQGDSPRIRGLAGRVESARVHRL